MVRYQIISKAENTWLVIQSIEVGEERSLRRSGYGKYGKVRVKSGQIRSGQELPTSRIGKAPDHSLYFL